MLLGAAEVLRLEEWEAELELCVYVVFCIYYFALTSFKTFLAASPKITGLGQESASGKLAHPKPTPLSGLCNPGGNVLLL